MSARFLLLPLLLAALVLAFAGATASADAYYPLLTVTGDAHLLGEVNDLQIGLEYLSSAGQTSSVSIQTPRGFSASFAQAAGTKLGTAELGTLPAGTNVSAVANPTITKYAASLMVDDAADYAGDPNAQSCDPGTHLAVWQLTAESDAHATLSVPIAVDASHGGYKLTVCFGALQAAAQEPEYLYLNLNQFFRNPGHGGNFLFDGAVSLLGSDAAGPGTAYELRAYEPLPQALAATATYAPATKELSVSGSYKANGKTSEGFTVDVYAATSANAVNWKMLGTTQTVSNGSYTFVKKFGAFPYHYLYTEVEGTNGPTCPGTSNQPQGCASISTDGRSSAATKIANLP